jgi:hypothetical protein
MNEHDQIRAVCRWNRRLSGENVCLRWRVAELERALAGERVQRQATDILLGSAVDGFLSAKRKPA